MKRNFIFMCGTPRSGTTYLAGIIGQHPSIALGVERFKFHYAGKTLSPELFEKDRFFDLRSEDTTARERIVLPRVAEMLDKYDRCKFVGDKYPNIVRHFSWIDDRFGRPAFLFVLRHPIHVARSWRVRANNKKDHWPEKNDFSAGVDYWIDTLRRVSAARSAGMNLIPIDYDLLAQEGGGIVRGHLSRIFNELGLPASEDVCSRLLESRSSGGDAQRPALTVEESEIMRSILESDAWHGFKKDFVDEEFLQPAWARS